MARNPQKRPARRAALKRDVSPTVPRVATPEEARLCAAFLEAEQTAANLEKQLSDIAYAGLTVLPSSQLDAAKHARGLVASLRMQLRGHQQFITLEVGRG